MKLDSAILFKCFYYIRAFSLAALSLSMSRRWWTSGWTATSETERRGCWCSSTSLCGPVDAKVRGQGRAHEIGVGGVKVQKIIFPISVQTMISGRLLISVYGNDAMSRCCVNNRPIDTISIFCESGVKMKRNHVLESNRRTRMTAS